MQLKDVKIKSSKKLLLLSLVTMVSTLMLIKNKSILNSDNNIKIKIQDFCSREGNFSGYVKIAYYISHIVQSDFWGFERSDNSGNLCSARSERRGRGQKVVSFSLWGPSNSGYWKGIVENLEVVEVHYPGWVVRLYVSADLVNRAALINLFSLHNKYHRQEATQTH